MQRFAGADAIAFLHVDVRTARDVVLALFTVVAGDDQFAFTLGDRTELDRAVDFRHDRGFARPASFEQLDDARQTAGDVLGLGGFTRNLGDDVARLDFFAVVDHQVRAHRHLVSLQYLVAGVANFQTRLFLFVRRVLDHHARQTGNLVVFFVERHAFLQVLELNVTGDFGQNGEGERIPGRQQLILRRPCRRLRPECAHRRRSDNARPRDRVRR